MILETKDLFHPPGKQSGVVFGCNLRGAELVPVGEAVAAEIPVRDDVMLPAQHAVERVADGGKLLQRLGGDELFK